jgi:2,4-dienoyl-CoA reductase-like NADH-dependent reductase (Old Yellow Enzyme family)
MVGLFDSVEFAHGPSSSNRFMLAPLTNLQSHADGTLSDDEFRWLEMRAAGGFGMTTTCAMHVQPTGQAFVGQLGCFSDVLVPGLTRLASGIHAHESLAIGQLHHGGNRADGKLFGGQPVCPSDDAEFGAREMTEAEVEESVEAFISAAERCKTAGFDGVQVHGAHGYLVCEFLSPETNRRTDKWGGSLKNRSRFMMEIVNGIRQRCGSDFHVGVRLSPERFGMIETESVQFFAMLVESGAVDLIDMSLWNVFKESQCEGFVGQRLIDIFAELDRGKCKLAVAGRLYDGDDAQRAIDAGADVVAIGRAAISNHDFPKQVRANPHFKMRETPIPVEVLRAEGLGDAFIEYMRTWRTFVGE